MPMTPHIQSLLDYINAHNHHTLRHDADWHLEDDFSARKLSPTKRSAEALKAMLAAETPAFILDERIARAKDLLRTTSLPCDEIAAACGVSDASHLAHLFRRKFGTSPTSFRKGS